MQLIVLGIQNSAVAKVTHILNTMGAYFAPEESCADNVMEGPMGKWEREDLRTLSDTLLSVAGASWDRIAAFHIEKVPKEAADRFTEKASALVSELDAHRPWMINDPRICLLLPLLRPILQTPLCIIVNRHPVQIASELRSFFGIPISVGVALWEKYTLSAISSALDLPKVFISFEDIHKDPSRTIKQFYNQLREHHVEGLILPDDRSIKSFSQVRAPASSEKDQIDLSFINKSQEHLFNALKSWESVQLKELGSISMEALEILFMFEDKADMESAYKRKCVEFAVQKEALEAREREYRISLKKAIDEKDSIIRANDRRLSDLGRELAELRKENKSLRKGKTDLDVLRKKNIALVRDLEKQRGKLIEAKQAIQGLKSQIGKLQKDIHSSEAALKTVKDLLRQSVSRLDRSKKQIAEFQSKLKRDEDEAFIREEKINSLKRDLQTSREDLGLALKKTESLQKEKTSLKRDLQTTRGDLGVALQKIGSLQEEIRSYKKKQRQAEKTLELRNSYLKTLENRLEHEKASVYKLSSWLRKLDSDFNALKQSKRWIVGNNAVRMLEIILFRKKTQMAMDHIVEILSEFGTWKSSGSKKK